jgi:hypothetical protein
MKGTACDKHIVANQNPVRVSLFISYSHLDKMWMKHLSPLLTGIRYDDRARSAVNVAAVSAWHDQQLHPGDKWDQEIRTAMDNMSIFVPLVSHHFFASKYVQTIEMPKAKKMHGKRKIQVLPILLDDVNLQSKCAFLHKFNPLPVWGRTWSSYKPLREAHRPIDDGLWSAITKELDKITMS